MSIALNVRASIRAGEGMVPNLANAQTVFEVPHSSKEDARETAWFWWIAEVVRRRKVVPEAGGCQFVCRRMCERALQGCFSTDLQSVEQSRGWGAA